MHDTSAPDAFSPPCCVCWLWKMSLDAIGISFLVAAKVQQFQQSWLGTGKVSEGPLNETAACDAARFLQKVSVTSLGQWWRSRVLPRLCWTSWRSLCPWRVPKGRKVGVFWLLTPFHALKKEIITAVQTWLYFHRTQRGGFRRNNFKAAKERITPQWPPLVRWNPRLFAAHWSWQTCQLKVLAAGRAPVWFQFHQTQKISKVFVAATPKLWKTLPMQWTQSQSLTQSLYALVFELLMYYENPRFGNSRSKALKHINRVEGPVTPSPSLFPDMSSSHRLAETLRPGSYPVMAVLFILPSDV